MDYESLVKLKGQYVKLVKNDGWVIEGRIKKVFEDSIEFFSDGRTNLMSFDRIMEIRQIVPYKNNRDGNSRGNHHGR